MKDGNESLHLLCVYQANDSGSDMQTSAEDQGFEYLAGTSMFSTCQSC
jgi:hypothetical protein